MTAPYPLNPGFKERGGTSQAAADAVALRATPLRAAILNMLSVVGNLTADQCADRLSESVLSVRPRFTELATRGRIAKTPERRPNASGHLATVWTLASPSNGVL